MGPEDELIARYQQVAGPYTMRIRIGVSLFFALIAGIGVSSQWNQWVLFTHYQSFHRVDPQFHKDIGFYVFQLPFLKFIAEWLFAGLVIVLIVTAVEHYLNGGIRFQSPFQRVTPQVKAHLSVILAVMALVKTAQYYLGRFELNFSTRGVVQGASATDVKAQLPALNLLIFISIGAAALFLWNIRRRGWVLPIIAVGLWAFVSLVIGTIYPAAYQQFKVGPNEYQAEAKYIDRNIRATRDAFGLDAVQTKRFDFESLGSLDANEATDAVQSNLTTINNARLWDPAIIRSNYATNQNFQTYYQIGDVDVDRYLVDGEVQQVLVAARGLNTADLPSQSFVNRHIVYTHGYGVVASPSNASNTAGNPEYLLKDVPTQASGLDLANGPPSQIYFAENLSSYVLTGAQLARVQLPARGRHRQVHALQGQGRRQAVELRAPRRVRTALRQSRPAHLRADQFGHEAPDGARHPRPRHQAGALPAVRRRSVPRGARRPHRVDHGRLHHLRPVPVRSVARRWGVAVVVVQLRAQLGEGHRRRLRGHRQLLRVRPEGPDHQGLRGGVPRPLHRRVADAEGDPRAPALPRRPRLRRSRRCSAATT